MAFSKAQQKIMADLLEMDGAVIHGASDPFASGIESPSPSFNYCFDNTWILPDGYTLLLGGLPKGGKSLLVSAMFGHLHQQDPDAVVLKFNTELRERAQVTPAQLRVWGIDPDRYRAYDVNLPEEVFDRLETIVPTMVQAGIKLRAVAIDSINDIQGRRAISADSVMTQQRGDAALTLQDGFKRIKGILRRHNVSLILTCQVRAEQVMAEQMRGNKIRFATSFYTQHLAEYYMMVERLKTKVGKTDLTGKEFKDGGVKVNMTGAAASKVGDESGHKIKVTMVDSSLGRPGRVGLFTIDHDRGIINTHEEVMLLGQGFEILKAAGGGNWSIVDHDALDDSLKQYKDQKWRGKESILEAIKTDSVLYNGILKTCKKIDLDRKEGVSYDSEGKRQIGIGASGECPLDSECELEAGQEAK